MPGTPSTTLDSIRRLLLILLSFGLIGTSAELTLMAHYEDWWQVIPLIVMGMALLTLVWFGFTHSRAATIAFRICLILLITAGLTGAILHYRANMEFQLEMDPTMGGMALLMKVLHAKAPPALAPGNMALLGLMGLISTLGVSQQSGMRGAIYR
jgi:hypothetical protein